MSKGRSAMLTANIPIRAVFPAIPIDRSIPSIPSLATVVATLAPVMFIPLLTSTRFFTNKATLTLQARLFFTLLNDSLDTSRQRSSKSLCTGSCALRSASMISCAVASFVLKIFDCTMLEPATVAPPPAQIAPPTADRISEVPRLTAARPNPVAAKTKPPIDADEPEILAM